MLPLVWRIRPQRLCACPRIQDTKQKMDGVYGDAPEACAVMDAVKGKGSLKSDIIGSVWFLLLFVNQSFLDQA